MNSDIEEALQRSYEKMHVRSTFTRKPKILHVKSKPQFSDSNSWPENGETVQFSVFSSSGINVLTTSGSSILSSFEFTRLTTVGWSWSSGGLKSVWSHMFSPKFGLTVPESVSQGLELSSEGSIWPSTAAVLLLSPPAAALEKMMFESPLAFEVLEVTLCLRDPGREVGGWTRALEIHFGQEQTI